MAVIKPGLKKTTAAAPARAAPAKAAPAAGGCREGCKWCAQGECWNSGQIEKPQGKGKGKGKGKGFSKGSGMGGGGGGLMELLLGGLLGGAGGGGKGGGKGKWKSDGRGMKVDKSGGELGEFTGVIKSFGWNKNYGFIECAEAGQGDIFLHGDQKKGFQQGHTVKFECVLNKEGKAIAINLKSGLK